MAQFPILCDLHNMFNHSRKTTQIEKTFGKLLNIIVDIIIIRTQTIC